MDSQRSSGNVVDLKTRASAVPYPELFGEIRALAFRRLPAILAEVLDQADDSLFEFVRRSSSSVEQQDYFDAMRELRRQRAAVEQNFREHFLETFTALERQKPLQVVDHAQQQSGGLSLIEPDELEEQLACERMASAIERRHIDSQLQLDQRMAKLVGLPAIPSSANPISPAHLCAGFRIALAGITMQIQAKLVLFKLFENEAMSAHGQLLHEANMRLHEAGLIPEALPVAPVVRAREAAPVRAERAVADEPAPRRAAGVSSGSLDNAAEPIDELFAKVQEVFAAYSAARRQVRDANAAPRPHFGGRAAVNVLTALQRAIPSSVMRAVDDQQVSLCNLLRQELLGRGQQMGLAAPNAEIVEQDEQAVFLVGALFDVMLNQRSYERGAREQFVRLSVPYAKAAMLDGGVLAQRAHPARRLLNELAEACDGNHGESVSERELLSRVTSVTDRLVSEFNEDMAIFSELEQEFRAYIEQYHRRIELAERRATEAQRGRERLEEARISAAMELALLMGAREAPPVLDGFLSRYWTHHLAVVSLRDGTDSVRFQEAKTAGEALWRAFLDCENGAPAPIDLHQHLLPVLGSSGLAGEAAGEVLEAVDWVLQAVRLGRWDTARSHQLPAYEAPAAIGSVVATDPLAPKPAAPVQPPMREIELPRAVSAAAVEAPAAAVAGTQEAPVEVPQLEVVGGTDTLDFEARDVERIRALEIGAWVEFVDGDGIAQPAKLSWVSPISSRLLFVNRRGMRLCANSAEELAAMMKQGKLVLREVDSAFERAMSQVLGKLQESVPDSKAG